MTRDRPRPPSISWAMCSLSSPTLLSTEERIFGLVRLCLSEISVPEDSGKVTSRPHRAPYCGRRSGSDPRLSPCGWSDPALHISIFLPARVIIPQTSEGVIIMVKYKLSYQISKLGQVPISHVDQVLNSLGSEPVFSLVVLVPSVTNSSAQGTGSPHSILDAHGSSRVSHHASGQQRVASVSRPGDQRGS